MKKLDVEVLGCCLDELSEKTPKTFLLRRNRHLVRLHSDICGTISCDEIVWSFIILSLKHTCASCCLISTTCLSGGGIILAKEKRSLMDFSTFVLKICEDET